MYFSVTTAMRREGETRAEESVSKWAWRVMEPDG